MLLTEFDEEAFVRDIREEGREEARAGYETVVINRMHENGFTVEQIMLATGKNEEEVKAIIEK